MIQLIFNILLRPWNLQEIQIKDSVNCYSNNRGQNLWIGRLNFSVAVLCMATLKWPSLPENCGVILSSFHWRAGSCLISIKLPTFKFPVKRSYFGPCWIWDKYPPLHRFQKYWNTFFVNCQQRSLELGISNHQVLVWLSREHQSKNDLVSRLVDHLDNLIALKRP